MALDQGSVGALELVARNVLMPGVDPSYSIAVGPDITPHAIYCLPTTQPTSCVLYYRHRAAGGWESPVRLSALNDDVWNPVLAVDGLGVAHVVYAKSPVAGVSQELFYTSVTDGVTVAPTQCIDPTPDSYSYYLGMAAATDGTVHVVYRRLVDDNGDLYYLTGKSGVFAPPERITQTPHLDESAATISLTPDGRPTVIYVEDMFDAPNGTIWMAQRN